MVTRLKGRHGSGIREATSYLGQNYLVVDSTLIPDFLRMLRDEEKFDYCVDVTAVHYPEREKQFDMVWILYSFERNERIRVKTRLSTRERAQRRFHLADGELAGARSVRHVWHSF